MAKKLTDTEPEVKDSQQPETPFKTPKTEVPLFEEPTPPQEDKKPKAPAAAAKVDVPDFADRLLKPFPGYPELYIDSHGGTFIPPTSASMRGDAILYKNPYYTKP